MNAIQFLDIDECAAGTSSCDTNAECVNTKGSYNCICKPGYHGDGIICEGQFFSVFHNSKAVAV